MSQLFDTERFSCGDPAALVSYIYGECSEAERDVIDAHLAHCAVCAEDVATLDSTRRQLGAWRPPARDLGFQITRAEAAAVRDDGLPEANRGATILRPAAWWNRPLPAWAQMAAAVLIFGAGLAIGAARTGTPAAPAPLSASNAPIAVPARVSATSAAPAAVSRDELAQLERRLQSEIAQVRTATPAAAAATRDEAVLQRVNRLIAASEERQQRELAFRTSQLVNDFTNVRKIDLMQIDQRLNNFERATGRRVESNQLDIRSLAQTVGYTLK